MNESVKVFLNEDEKYSLISDGEATLSYLSPEDIGLGNLVFGLSMSNGGGFSTLLCSRKDWEEMKKKVDYFLEEKNE